MELYLPCLNTAIAGILAILVFFYFIIKRSSSGAKAKSLKPPKVEGGWPLLGHLDLFGGSQLPHIALASLAGKYGPIFTVKIGIHSALVISTWEAAKDCFTTNDIAVSSRPARLGIKHLSYNYAMFGFSPYGTYWREIRKLTSLELLSNRRLELLRNVRASEVEMSLKELYTLWSNRKEGPGELLVDMKQWFGGLTLNVIFRMIAGKRCFMNGDSSEEKEARRWQKAMGEFFHFLGLFLLGDAVPWLSWLDLGGQQKAMKRTAKELDSILAEWLEEHKQKRTKGKDQDFIDVMLSAIDGANVAGFDADTVIKATCLTMISGGSDTTMVTLTWALSLLLNNRQVLKKVYEELDQHVGKSRLLNESDINNLVYLSATIKEAMRLCPPGPLSVQREFREDCTVEGYQVPKGTWLLVNLWKIQTDPRVWADPMEFKPERFLTTHKDVDVRGQQFELMPFGTGRRVCPGISLGLQTTLLTLASFLHSFEVTTRGNAAVDMTGSPGLTNRKLTPLDVLIKPRLSPHLYE
ncbi:PREDICTED: cytochrome P450 [Prunus dulcis]|uniref:PREDICTED: cytochrome P450 n=1 Tax=Prunus dulcis TaxID=3755 RepID=A0A5E4ETC7_PRUDU|nr:cytochrome P450 CYP82D47-like [Prunus dulcis]VVA18696.1 PREDICTED: cytochrome P450 [Prunus dulcis]